MKSNELRIGNYLLDVDKEITKIDGVVKDRVYYTQKRGLHAHYSVFEPIPLTEEWLIKFGFEKAVLNTWVILPKELFSSITIGKDNSGFYVSNLPAPIKYVHQLQNLYFTLTNTELILKQ